MQARGLVTGVLAESMRSIGVPVGITGVIMDVNGTVIACIVSEKQPCNRSTIAVRYREAHEQPIVRPCIRATRPCLGMESHQAVLGLRGTQDRLGAADCD